MRYFILFFCLFFNSFTILQANYSVPQNTNYQVVGYKNNPIEPIKTKKNKVYSPYKINTYWVGFSFLFCLIIFLTGLILFPIAFVAGILLFWLIILGFELFAILFAIFVLFGEADDKGDALTKGLFAILLTIFLVLKGIELLILGILTAYLAMWLTAAILLLLVIIFVLLFSF